jgi:molybdopterin synthase sulfur carrier subunit
MAITVKLGSPFRRHTGGADSITSSAADLSQLFGDLETRFPGLTKHLVNENGDPRPFLNVYVNDEDIRFLGGKTYQFTDKDEVLLIPAVAGGCC